ncbi:MAG: Stk1 family PASTA domain-containing Ser/Thr kinase [Lachnoclostridium sp.]|nr:Stk1 family PASTA domain-containing Ser/Thr kinase [Lachnospira sp.]MCM1247155.1 Stk1 family PASTA domain-containing Ser/Thr kinase [Lachnoclostridium sp.]MCM1534624.1 Stk1 family PASTA domain-containing Ser/Thr kinase [Clostridium sp.]
MIKIGMMIGDRYEILEKIGTGGMSDVYKAKCHKLNRFVAIKVLKQEFGENENFVSKFHVEAQAAAGLMHPNIVNVYDVGEENGIHYIVMELVEGITLKKYIEKKARLTYKEAVSIAIQVSMGIEAAHNNHIIHRDIKPQNIIISKDGKVKVTDFGIAKAATSNTITSNVMGSVHYTSPEQARGGYSDEKSDIYSLGITMFEMLTGRVPFNGETTVAIAIKHIQEEMPSPKEYVPEIPASVEGIVLKCCQKSPDRRYQNMQELIGDLKQSLLNPDEDFVSMSEPDMEGGTRMISDSDMEQIKRRTAAQMPPQSSYQGRTGYSAGYSTEYPAEYPEEEPMRLLSDTAALYEDAGEMEDEEDYREDSKVEHITTFFAVLAAIIIVIIFIIIVFMLFDNRNTGNSPGTDQPSSPIIDESDSQTSVSYEEMPNVVGLSVEDARNALINLGFFVNVIYEESDTIDTGVVIRADAAAYTSIQVGSTITLTTSMGKQGVDVPTVTGFSYEEANAELVSAGFTVNKKESYSDTVEKNQVINQMPEGGSRVPKGSVITIDVSRGKEETKVRVPKLVGLSEQDGTFAAIEAKLQIGSVSYVYSETEAEGIICYQSSSIDSMVEPGTEIDIKVSQGPSPVTYKYNASIAAPTKEEAPEYESGMDVKIVLETDDNKILLDTTVSVFPRSENYYGLTAPGGTITMTYTVTKAGTTETNPDTGEAVNTPGTTEEKSFTRRVEFVKE